jgi:hypothetical protein
MFEIEFANQDNPVSSYKVDFLAGGNVFMYKLKNQPHDIAMISLTQTGMVFLDRIRADLTKMNQKIDWESTNALTTRWSNNDITVSKDKDAFCNLVGIAEESTDGKADLVVQVVCLNVKNN